jgi:Uma2 family endonuclease
MPSAAEKVMSLDEFLAWERQQPERYEFVRGVVAMREGQTIGHNIITMNLYCAIREKLRSGGCRIFASSVKVIASGSVRYPDLSVTSHRVNGKDDIVPDPVLIIEIASPLTEVEDRGRKKFDYFGTPSIRQYVIVEQDERRVDLYTRAAAAWTNEVISGDGIVNLSSIGVTLGLDAIYEDTELAATRQPAGERPAPAA